MKRFQIGMYEKAVPEECTLAEIFEIGKKTGYDFWEMSIDRTDKRIQRLYDDLLVDKLRKLIDETGFSIGSLCLSALGRYTLGNPDPGNIKKAIDIFEHAVLFSERLGIRIIQIPACDVPKNEPHTKKTDTLFQKNLKIMTEFAAAHSVMIGLENMEDAYMNSIEKCLRLIRFVNSPYLQLYADSGNISEAAHKNISSIKRDMLLGEKRYCAFHLKEARTNKYGGLFFGEGDVDFESIVSIAFNDLGIRRYVLEYWYTGNQSWTDDLIRARSLCESWISSAISMRCNHE